MKVTDVICHVPQSKVEQPFTSARSWHYATRASCTIEIRTDEGITGWGECYGRAEEAVRILAGERPRSFINPEAWEASPAKRTALGGTADQLQPA
ncbi:hypothetical protein [Roseomonas chloroacetimidivorans]|uniref:hypothetical protein n=1 Tax=Roseomonas chloroacetimidivorans TaxID=1766656 RepID=UPI003C74F871